MFRGSSQAEEHSDVATPREHLHKEGTKQVRRSQHWPPNWNAEKALG